MLGNRGIGWSLTAVIFGMIIFSELKAVVAAALQVSLAASVAVMLTSITRSVTVSLSLPTGLLWRTAPLASRKVSPRTALPSCRLEGAGMTGIKEPKLGLGDVGGDRE